MKTFKDLVCHYLEILKKQLHQVATFHIFFCVSFLIGDLSFYQYKNQIKPIITHWTLKKLLISETGGVYLNN